MLAPTGERFNTTLSFRRWKCNEYLRRIYSGYRNNDKHHPNANWPSAKTERCSPLRVRDLIPLCHLEKGNIPNTAAGYNRAGAETTNSILNANRSTAAAGRAGAKAIRSIFNPNRHSGRSGGRGLFPRAGRRARAPLRADSHSRSCLPPRGRSRTSRSSSRRRSRSRRQSRAP